MSCKEFRSSFDLAAVFARNKALFGDLRMEADAGDGGDAGGGQGSGDGAGTGASGGSKQQSDRGYPENTPLEQMTAEQQANYWKTQSRKHEQRAKQFDGLTMEELTGLRDKASKHDALERELMSDKDKATADATEAATKARDAHWLPQLVRAEFKAAFGSNVTPEDAQARLARVDLMSFVDAKGEIDSKGIAEYAAQFAPKQTQQQGPSTFGFGNRPQVTGAPGERGAAMAAKRFGKKS